MPKAPLVWEATYPLGFCSITFLLLVPALLARVVIVQRLQRSPIRRPDWLAPANLDRPGHLGTVYLAPGSIETIAIIVQLLHTHFHDRHWRRLDKFRRCVST